jgi:hypothetical protein
MLPIYEDVALTKIRPYVDAYNEHLVVVSRDGEVLFHQEGEHSEVIPRDTHLFKNTYIIHNHPVDENALGRGLSTDDIRTAKLFGCLGIGSVTRYNNNIEYYKAIFADTTPKLIDVTPFILAGMATRIYALMLTKDMKQLYIHHNDYITKLSVLYNFTYEYFVLNGTDLIKGEFKW